jgi:uncharacterized protein (TIGR02594 family)
MPQPRWLALAWADLGVAETPGPDHTQRVLAYYAAVGHAEVAGDETAWCAAFLGACLERAGIASTRSLAARSYVDWGEPAPSPRVGAVAVLARGGDPALGHVGFVVGSTPAQIILLGGNQGDAVTVEAFPRARLIALRWPSVIPEGAPAPIRDPGAASDPAFERALAHLLKVEGGWVDDPHDPGGPTCFGITLATYAADKGVALTRTTVGALKAELRNIAPAAVRRIYRERYWRAAACAQLPPALAFFHFDAAVSHGVAGAARLLQEAVGADVDGEIGPQTLAKAAARPMPETLALYAAARRRHYRSLSTFWRFGKGWLARADRALTAALALPAAVPATDPPEPKEKPAMANETQSPTAVPAAPDSKWWGHSMTVWGIVITTLSFVLPTLAPLVGLDITAELVQQLGQQIVVVVQAVGALIGTLLTIFGRMRASGPLSSARQP